MTPRRLPGELQLLPSLLAADFARLAAEIESVTVPEVEALHLDVMDGHFVPNITFGPALVAAVRAQTQLFLDTHLMVADPLRYLGPFAASGADLLTLHAEAICDPSDESTFPQAVASLHRASRELSPRGCRLGLSFRPASDPLPLLSRVGPELDLVLLMTVEPGFGGQAFRIGQLERVADLRRWRDREGQRWRIEVDGGIGPQTARRCAAAGAEWLVAGSAVFGQADRPAACRAILQAAREGQTLSP
jgi:ribulose-phosphate 3-epimerase